MHDQAILHAYANASCFDRPGAAGDALATLRESLAGIVQGLQGLVS